MDSTEDTLRKLKKVQLLSLLEIKRICDKHNIIYTPIGGTLLGTIRHGGFIPWDDDIDVGMLRSEYDRFIEVAKTELRPEFFLQTYETDPNYPKRIGRMMVNDTKYLFHSTHKAEIHHGVFTDLFPYDNAPNNHILQKIHKYLIWWLKYVATYKYKLKKYHTLKSKIIIPLLSLPFIFIDKLQVRTWLEKIMRMYNKCECEYVVRTGSGYPYEKVMVKKELMSTVEPHLFEGFEISVMTGYHEHLVGNYGDYMELPPVEKRRNVLLETVKIDLGKYDDEEYLDSCLEQYR